MHNVSGTLITGERAWNSVKGKFQTVSIYSNTKYQTPWCRLVYFTVNYWSNLTASTCCCLLMARKLWQTFQYCIDMPCAGNNTKSVDQKKYWTLIPSRIYCALRTETLMASIYGSCYFFYVGTLLQYRIDVQERIDTPPASTYTSILWQENSVSEWRQLWAKPTYPWGMPAACRVDKVTLLSHLDGIKHSLRSLHFLHLQFT